MHGMPTTCLSNGRCVTQLSPRALWENSSHTGSLRLRRAATSLQDERSCGCGRDQNLCGIAVRGEDGISVQTDLDCLLPDSHVLVQTVDTARL